MPYCQGLSVIGVYASLGRSTGGHLLPPLGPRAHVGGRRLQLLLPPLDPGSQQHDQIFNLAQFSPNYAYISKNVEI